MQYALLQFSPIALILDSKYGERWCVFWFFGDEASVRYGIKEVRSERISQALRLLSTGLNYHIWNSLKHLNPLDHWRPLFMRKKKKHGVDEKICSFHRYPNPLPPPPVSQWHHVERMIVWKSVKCSRHMLICVELSLCLCVRFIWITIAK